MATAAPCATTKMRKSEIQLFSTSLSCVETPKRDATRQSTNCNSRSALLKISPKSNRLRVLHALHFVSTPSTQKSSYSWLASLATVQSSNVDRWDDHWHHCDRVASAVGSHEATNLQSSRSSGLRARAVRLSLRRAESGLGSNILNRK